MELLLNRYRSVTVLVAVLLAQLLLLAFQIRTHQDVPLIRVWAISAIMPFARLLETVRSGTVGRIGEYGELMSARDANRELRRKLATLELENNRLRADLATADRARALQVFQTRTPSRTVAARIIGAGTVSNSKVVLVDRGSRDGVKKGMAVIVPKGIVGKVTLAGPDWSQVVLITDPSFAAGVISEKHRIHGALKGQGHSICAVDYVQNEEQLEAGEWLFTSGDDLIFPKGLPVGQVKSASNGKMFFKDVEVVPSGLQAALEDVLIVIEGVHQVVPDPALANQPLHLLTPPPPESRGPRERVIQGTAGTDADQLVDRYRRIGAAQRHVFGQGGPPNLNLPVDGNPPPGKERPPK